MGLIMFGVYCCTLCDHPFGFSRVYLGRWFITGWRMGPQRRDTGQHAKCTNYCCSEKQEAAKKSQVVESCGVQWLCCGFLWNHYIVTIWPPPSTATGEERSGNAPMQKVSFQSAHIIIKSLLVSLPVGYNCAVIDLSTFVEW